MIAPLDPGGAPHLRESDLSEHRVKQKQPPAFPELPTCRAKLHLGKEEEPYNPQKKNSAFRNEHLNQRTSASIEMAQQPRDDA